MTTGAKTVTVCYEGKEHRISVDSLEQFLKAESSTEEKDEKVGPSTAVGPVDNDPVPTIDQGEMLRRIVRAVDGGQEAIKRLIKRYVTVSQIS